MRYLLVLIVCLAFPALSQTTSDSIPMDHRLVISAMLRTYSLHQGGKVNFSVSEKSEFLRSWSFYLNDYLPDINLSDNRLSQSRHPNQKCTYHRFYGCVFKRRVGRAL